MLDWVSGLQRQEGHTSHTRYTVRCTRVCSDTAWGIPCCVVGSASISGEGPMSAVVAPLWELEDDGTEVRSEESGIAT